MDALPTEHAVDMAGVGIKTYTERLAGNTAVLRTHGKLIETVLWSTIGANDASTSPRRR
jgi:hypothetical protein